MIGNRQTKPSNETVAILRPDETEFDAVAQFNHSHFNIPEATVSMDRRWRVTIGILNVAKDDVPIGSKLFVHTEVANPLQDKQAQIR